MAPVRVTGRTSWFGGPDDTGVSPSEGLAFIYEYEQNPDLFLAQQPSGTTGLARRLNPNMFYVAIRWDYNVTSKTMLADPRYKAMVRAGGKEFMATPADWGPHIDTGRVADISPGLMAALGISTDDTVEIEYPFEQEIEMPRIAMSSGHSTKCQGAIGVINEVEEATRVVDRVAEMITAGGGTCVKFHDTVSTSQNENLNRITDWHNQQARDYDASVHFNASQPTEKPMGTECWYVTQSQLAAKLSSAMAGAGGFKNRGAKYTEDFFFLNKTHAKSVLLEVCFVDSDSDCRLYEEAFEEICTAIALALVPELQLPGEPSEPPPIEVEQVVDVKINAPPGVRVDVSINQE